MRTSFAAMAAASLVLAAVAMPASATQFVGTYSESHAAADPGLVLQTNNLAPSPFSFSLTNVGDVAHQDLFQIYTNESSLDFDDLFGKPISVTLSFTQPDVFGGTIGGTTDGVVTLSGFFNLKQNNFGTVSWANNGNTVLNFGNGGLLGVHLDDANFNLKQTGVGKFALNPGIDGGATITADFKLLKNSTGAVPEPATWAMMITGFGLAGTMLRQKRRVMAA